MSQQVNISLIQRTRVYYGFVNAPTGAVHIVCLLYVCTASVKRLTRLQLCSAKASSSGEPIDNAKGIERNHRASIELRPRWSSHTQAPKSPPQRLESLDFAHTHTHATDCLSVHAQAICALRRTQTYSDVLRRTQTYSIYSCRVLEHPHLCAQTGASRAFRACVGQADAQGASCQAATRPLSLESLWSEQKELKVKGLESLWSEKKELKELKVKCGWPAAVKHLRLACGSQTC